MAGKTTRILLVDDEQPVQKLLTYPLQKEGYEVVPALDGQEALASFDEWATEGLRIPRVSVNVSARRLQDQELIKGLRELDIKAGSSGSISHSFSAP